MIMMEIELNRLITGICLGTVYRLDEGPSIETQWRGPRHHGYGTLRREGRSGGISLYELHLCITEFEHIAVFQLDTADRHSVDRRAVYTTKIIKPRAPWHLP